MCLIQVLNLKMRRQGLSRLLPRGVFIGQTNEFFQLLTDLGGDADAVRREFDRGLRVDHSRRKICGRPIFKSALHS